MKKPLLFLTLFAALLCARAIAAPPSIFPEPGQFRIVPADPEPVMFDGASRLIFGTTTTAWKGSTLYVESLPVVFESPRVSLAQPYLFSMEAFHRQVLYLFTRPVIILDIRSRLPPPPRADGKFNFNIGYQF
jgi:hypothetical protein